MTIPELVEAIQKKYNWTQDRLAKELRKKPSEISRWVSGKHGPRAEMIGKMERLLESQESVGEIEARFPKLSPGEVILINYDGKLTCYKMSIIDGKPEIERVGEVGVNMAVKEG